MDGWGLTARGAGSPGGVSAMVPSFCCTRAPCPPRLLQGIRLTSTASHTWQGWSCTMSHSHQVFVPLGKQCPWGKVPTECLGGEHRGPAQLRGLEVALKRVELVARPEGATAPQGHGKQKQSSQALSAGLHNM